MCFVDALAFAFSGQGVGCKFRASAFDDISNINAQSLGAAIDKSEVEVLFATFAFLVFTN